jgi:hypothetical protein
MVHYVYKITNLLNGMFYIGKHSTDYIDDGYMGSGAYLQRAITKHGLDNFKKEILQMFETSDQALAYEKELVTEDFVSRNDTYNLNVGGNGGWFCANSNSELQKLARAKAVRTMNAKIWSNPDYMERHRVRASERLKRFNADGRMKSVGFTGKAHTDATKKKVGSANSKHQSGSGNSNFGNVWMYSLLEKRSIRVPLSDIDTWLANGWHKGRKFKFV